MYKKIFNILIVILACSLFSRYISAQVKYPERPIQVVVPYSGGSMTEVAVRLLGDSLVKYLGQPFVVINKPGAAGAIGGNEMFKSKPDGYTIAMLAQHQSAPEFYLNPERFLYKSKDIQAVCQWSGYQYVLCVKGDAPWKTLNEFIENAKNKPHTLRWSHNGKGGGGWTYGAVFVQQSGIKLLDVPFGGDGEQLIALLGNHVDMSILTYTAANRDQLKAKKIRGLGVPLKKRYDSLPDIPTMEELGFRPHGIELYLGIFVPKGTPREAIDKISSSVRKVTEEPEFKEKMERIGYPVWYKDTKDFEENVQNVGKKSWELFHNFGLL